MFTQDSHEQYEEIRNAEQMRDKHLEHWEGMIERFHGSAFTDIGTDHNETENHALTFTASMMPRLLWNNPSVRVKTRRAEAVLKNGLLRICFPKVPNRRGEAVPIEVETE